MDQEAKDNGVNSLVQMAKGMARGMAANNMPQESATMLALCKLLETRATTARDALHMLRDVGGNLGALAEAGLLAMGKGEDYNKHQDPREARDAYFPLGLPSYAQMIHVKSQRLLAFCDAERKGRKANFEGVRDTALDVINYGSFLADWQGRQGG
jgi:hypothetical protein